MSSTLPNGVSATVSSSVQLGFDLVHAAYDAASAIVNGMENSFLNPPAFRYFEERKPGPDIDTGENPWGSFVRIMAGIISGHKVDRGAMDDYLLGGFSEWFSVLLASNIEQDENRNLSRILITGHRVLGIGPIHTAIQGTTVDGQIVWLSAAPVDGVTQK